MFGEVTEAPKKAAVTLEERPEQLGQGQYEMPVGHGQENVVDQVGGGGLDLALVAGRAEPAAFAGEGQEKFVAAVVAAYARKAPFQDAAVEEFSEHYADHWPEGTVPGLIGIGVAVHEGGVVTLGTLPERGFTGIAGAVGLQEGRSRARFLGSGFRTLLPQTQPGVAGDPGLDRCGSC